jgi:hypothetical protein
LHAFELTQRASARYEKLASAARHSSTIRRIIASSHSPHVTKDSSLQDLQNLKALRGSDPRLSHARHIGDYQMWLQFADGRAGIVDFSNDLWGTDLEPLRDRVTFEELAFDETLATLSWESGGIDISPSYLYSKLESVQ